jgi:hypothetical protein
VWHARSSFVLTVRNIPTSRLTKKESAIGSSFITNGFGGL